MIRVRIADDFLAGGIAILVEQRGDGIRVLYRASEDGYVVPYEQITSPEGAQRPPTLRMDEDIARALLQALANWYGGTSEAATARADLLHERGRVDKLTEAIIGIATKPGGNHHVA